MNEEQIGYQRKLYKITISEITRAYVEETKEVYVDEKTGNQYDYWTKDKAPDPEKLVTKKQGTGKMNVDERKQDVYEQEKESIDIGEIAMFINRAR